MRIFFPKYALPICSLRILFAGFIVTLAMIGGEGAAFAQSPQAVRFAGLDGVTLQGALYVPKGNGPFPAIVALHGCAGLNGKNDEISPRHRDWGERLAAQGYVVLFSDSFASRGLGPQCRNATRDVKPSRERVADALAALAFLANQSNVDAKAISLFGWSNGASSVLYAVAKKNAPSTGPDFVRAIGFYPGCRVPLESGTWQTRMPLLILIGEADDWTPAAPCKDLVASAGGKARIVTYPDAYHDFDHPDLPVHTVDHLAFTATGTGVAHTGTNPAARADAINQVMNFLAH
jgi:dienelactone hydrolase